MEYILNEFSLDAQFNNTDDFVESLYKNTLPILRQLNKKNINLLKSYNIYSIMVTDSKNLQDILQDRSYPEIRAIKNLLVQLFLDNPYWDNESECIEGSTYKCEFTQLTNNHCIAEALERNTSVVSFEHNEFKSNKINIIKDGLNNDVNNIFNDTSILTALLESKCINFNEYLCSKYKNIETFCVINNKNYFEEFIKESSLSDQDISSIIKDIEDMIYKYNNSLDLGRLSKQIEHYYEFRTSLSNNRQIRIFYTMNSNNFIFLNCLLKKQQSTPERAKEQARKLIDEYDKLKKR